MVQRHRWQLARQSRSPARDTKPPYHGAV